MPVVLRCVLIVVSFLTTWYVIRKIRKSQMQIEDTIFWFGLSGFILILSIIPEIASWASDMIGIESPVSFVFLAIIFILLLKVFFLSLKLSQIDNKLNTLVQENAIKENLETHHTE